ncbi:MAG: DUF192 domain-containing protein [Proteobacteria bacterium]|nr:DUF192 domain-containing protein [Pseudomonadota bacterium]
MNQNFAVTALLFLLLAVAPGFAQDDVVFDRSTLKIETAEGVHSFDVELAVNDDQRARGLMFRNEMAPDAGMLFVYRSDRVLTMWMANTYLPLDMLFIGADGRIVRIAENTIPLSHTTISSRMRARAVLELNAGTARRLGISAGDRVLYDGLPGQ